MGIAERIKELEEEYEKTPKNKGTEHHLGKLKAKIAQLREQLATEASKKSGKSEHGYSVKKTGDATVVFIGFPSAGKSTLLNNITNAQSEIGDYEFTTLNVVPGIMEYKGARIQVLDIPGIIEDASRGKGRGREILSVARIADLIVFVIDGSKGPEQIETLRNELYRIGIRLDQEPPDITITKKDRGGIIIKSTVKQRLTEETIKGMLTEYGILNAEVILREDYTIDRLIDAISKNRVYVPSLILVNKKDLLSAKDLEHIKAYFSNNNIIFTSALRNENIDALKEEIFKTLNIMRVYTKEIGKDPKLDEPMIVKEGAKVKDIAQSLHKDFLKYFLHAKIWGKSAKFPGQKVGLEHVLKDEDIIELWMRK